MYVADDYSSQSNFQLSESLSPETSKPPSGSDSLWTFAYYQKFFQITTDQLISRLVWSMFPVPGKNFYKDYIQSNPDLYGPIWISLTLIFTVTMAGNLGSYLQLSATGDSNILWKYDFHLISLAATCIISYCWILPLLLWGIMKWSSGEQVKVSYLELTCVYGYCITIFIPISLLWVIFVKWMQWFLAGIGTLLSGTVLLKSLLPLVGSKNYLFVIVMFCSHFLLSSSLLWNFFQSSHQKHMLSTIVTDN